MRTTDQHLAALLSMNTRSEAAEYVAKIRGAGLHDLANRLSVRTDVSVAQIRQNVIDATAGTREDTAAIRSHGWR